ncbi:hypothetical protein [Pedobacter rhizosphaerae]|uniref:Uncharacterized protein n=1 Tax=Pedobacter rhizosphaerae TaxID=390241 RepID=A0A1H9T030_9SPHI|nr:hypothetical protein [Pedobacter rhizosphaerae]SER90622.1 hypothetical protein SAMN04488023_12031 [Pedobacter rhizosphaerae]
MSRKNDYERVANLNKNKARLLTGSTIITLFLTLNEKNKWSESYPQFADYLSVIIAINSMLIVCYIAFEMRANYIFTKAEKQRKLQYLDNSFGTNFANSTVQNYFTQDQIQPGFYKLCVNCFENSFHTYNVVKAMQPKTYLKAAVVLVVFIFSASVGDKGVIRALIESILPLALIQDAIKTSIVITRLENIVENFRSFFNGLKHSDFTNKEPEAMKYIIEYETTLAWASMPTDSDLFFKLQDELAGEWEEIKKSYQINVVQN